MHSFNTCLVRLPPKFMIPDPLLIVWGKEKKNQLNIKLGKKHEYSNWENCKSLAWSHKNNVNNQKFLIRGVVEFTHTWSQSMTVDVSL